MTAGSSPAAPPPPRAAPASSSQSAPTCPSRPHGAQQEHLLVTVRLADGVVPAACQLLAPRRTHLSRQLGHAGRCRGAARKGQSRARHFGGVVVLTVEKASASEDVAGACRLSAMCPHVLAAGQIPVQRGFGRRPLLSGNILLAVLDVSTSEVRRRESKRMRSHSVASHAPCACASNGYRLPCLQMSVSLSPLCRFAASPLRRFAALSLCRFAALPFCRFVVHTSVCGVPQCLERALLRPSA